MKRLKWNHIVGSLILLLLLGLTLFLKSSTPLWPPLLAIAFLFFTQSAAFSLFAGALLGSWLLTRSLNFPLVLFSEHFWPSLGSKWHWSALIFTLMLAIFAAITERSGALAALLQKWTNGKSSQKKDSRFQLSIIALGFACFFDGLANALMLGRVGSALADQARVSREKLSYLVDTTSSAVACLAFLSTWTVTQLSLITSSLEGSVLSGPSYLLFLKSIPTNFYCLTSLLLIIFSAMWNWNLPPMSATQARPFTKALSKKNLKRPLLTALGPTLILLAAVPLSFWILGSDKLFPSSLNDIQLALNTSKGPYALLLAGGLAILGAILFFPENKKFAFKVMPSAVSSTLPALCILILAWTLGSTLGALGTGEYLAAALGEDYPLPWLPATVFLLGCLISFSTGTSWGTMGLLMPIALGTLVSLTERAGLSAAEVGPILPATIGAVFGGAVFGDHASPFSDTTIISALACEITTTAHVATQLPFALVAAACSLLFGYLPLALGAPTMIAFISALLSLAIFVSLSRKYFCASPATASSPNEE